MFAVAIATESFIIPLNQVGLKIDEAGYPQKWSFIIPLNQVGLKNF